MLERLLFTLAGLAAGFMLSLGAPTAPAQTPTAPHTSAPSTPSAHTSAPTPSAPVSARYLVEKVMDGDTIAVMRDGTYTKVRIIGINSPEIYADTKPAQCYGQEAAQEAHRMLDGSSVSLTTDPTQDTYDKYGRLLAYITLTDDSDFGAYMVTNGFAREYTYRVAYQRQKTYRAAQASAQQSRAGLWGRCAQ